MLNAIKERTINSWMQMSNARPRGVSFCSTMFFSDTVSGTLSENLCTFSKVLTQSD